ncbi:MAG TPA: hypothetical protein VFH68_19240 [Polyangia bacterium]|nr:hypothetical protein [Polyangia bacterium]
MAVSLAGWALAAGCADPGAGDPGTGTSIVPATARASIATAAGSAIAPASKLRRAASAGARRFHANAAGTQLSAVGERHRLEIRGGVARVQRLTAPAERRQWLLARARAAADGVAARAIDRPAPPALEIQTLSIARAGYQCLDGATASVVDEGGGAYRRFATCGERWSNGAQHGEVAFDFARRPAGAGDLVVTLRARIGAPAVERAMVVSADDAGLRLATPGGERFRFGHATWIDAAGRRSPVPARFRAGVIELSVPAAVVDGSRYPAVLDPIVGPDLGTDTPVLQPSSSGIEPEVASDGVNSLVVFSDFQRIRAVRADANGDVLEFDWLDLGEDGFLQFRPMVAFGGGRYLVVWWQDDGAAISIRGRLIDPDGTIVGAASFPISSAEGVDAAVAWNGQSFVVGWGGFGPAPGVRIALVGPDGTVVAGSERQVSPTNLAFEQRIAAGLTTALVVWEEQIPGNFSSLFLGATRIAQDGTVLDPAGIRVDQSDTFQSQPAVGSDGQQFLVAWQRGGEAATIQGAIIDQGGLITAAPFPISRSPGGVSRPAVAFGAGEFLVAWQAQTDADSILAGTAVSPGGAVQGAADSRLASVQVRGGADPTGLTWNGSRFVLTFDGIRPQPDGFSIFGIDGSMVASDLSIAADALAFSQLPNHQFSPHAAWDGLSYLVTWSDERDPGFGQDTARAVRISGAGVVRDPAGIAVSAPQRAFSHHLASNGDRRSLVVWQTTTGRGAVRSIAGNGTQSPIRALAPGSLASNPLLASNGSTFLSAFARSNAAGTGTDLVGTFVAANGNPGGLFTIRRAATPNSLVAAGDDYLVQFSDGGDQLLIVGSSGRVSAPVPSPSGSQTLVAASGSRNTLVGWVTSTGQVQARFFARAAFRGPTLSISPTSDGFAPTVAFDGARYWIVWAADRETERPMIRSVEVGGALGETSLVVDQGCESPELASDGAQQLILTCFEFTNRFRVARITTRLIDTSDATATVAAAPVVLAGGD